MEKNHKIIIVGLIIVIIALVVGLAYMMVGNNLSGGGNVPEGMERYNFDSVFSMAVPKDSKFLKTVNSSALDTVGYGASFFDKNNEIYVSYAYSPFFTQEFMDYFVNSTTDLGNATWEFEGNLMISHHLKNDGKVGETFEDTNFKELILIRKGQEIFIIEGNNPDLIKSMANTIEFNE